jgi:hypothetical protein
MDILTLEYKVREGEVLRNRTTKTERRFIDFIVSGHSLGKHFGLPEFDLVGVFGWSENKEYENQKVDEFLGNKRPELETGRSSFYVCSECGDIGCGAITAKIEVTDSIVIWKDFGYENNYSEPDLEDYSQVGPFIFNKTEYNKAIEKLKVIS